MQQPRAQLSRMHTWCNTLRILLRRLARTVHAPICAPEAWTAAVRADKEIDLTSLRLAQATFAALRRHLQGPWQQLRSLRARPQQLQQLCTADAQEEEED